MLIKEFIPGETKLQMLQEQMMRMKCLTNTSLVTCKLQYKGVNNGHGITSPVYGFPEGVTPVGAYGMAGNLIEWVYDSEYTFTANSTTNPINKSETRRLQKGAFWVGSAGRKGASPNEI